MPNHKHLASEEKLDALRKADPVHKWLSLDDRRSCILATKLSRVARSTSP
jgi:hypothetical protein